MDSSGSSDSEGEKAVPDKCLVCKSAAVEFKCMPCQCPCACKKCAMKLATGGRCKSCGQMFSEFKRLV